VSIDLNALGERVAGAMPGVVLDRAVALGELTLTVDALRIKELLLYLRNDTACAFTTLIDIAGVDYPERSKRFDVVYHLLSMTLNHRIRVRVHTDEATPVPSVVSVFSAADWFEREAFDMYGILFSDHPDMRRILTDYGFTGYPLRKDFPMTGYVEVRYDEAEKRVVYEPVKLNAEYRNFDFSSPWEGIGLLPGDEKAPEKAP
jgi:NADH-quinone oxidoreductase subunit C